jgi:membrane-bound metal-dependent hydrolase YbcI (DUF457 family)
MPVTPYHFGPALVAKGLLKNRFCLISFAISQIIIDLESVYYLIKEQYPIHRFLHSYLGATLVILLTIVLIKPIVKIFKTKSSYLAITIASLFGGYSHILLDSIMHGDMKPLSPLSDSNTLLRIIDLTTLHNFCLYSGVLGFSILAWQYYRIPQNRN